MTQEGCKVPLHCVYSTGRSYSSGCWGLLTVNDIYIVSLFCHGLVFVFVCNFTRSQDGSFAKRLERHPINWTTKWILWLKRYWLRESCMLKHYPAQWLSLKNIDWLKRHGSTKVHCSKYTELAMTLTKKRVHHWLFFHFLFVITREAQMLVLPIDGKSAQ